MDLAIEWTHPLHPQLVMYLLKMFQEGLVTQDFGVQLCEIQIRTVFAVHCQHRAGHLDQATGPSPIVRGVEATCLPARLDGRSSGLHHHPWIVAVTAEPACGRGEGRGEDLLLQARPGEAVERLDPILQRDDLTIQAVELLAGALAR